MAIKIKPERNQFKLQTKLIHTKNLIEHVWIGNKSRDTGVRERGLKAQLTFCKLSDLEQIILSVPQFPYL